MKKQKRYLNTRFGADVLREAFVKISELADRASEKLPNSIFRVHHQDATWSYDNVDEFMADYRTPGVEGHFSVYGGPYDLDFSQLSDVAIVGVKTPNRAEIEAVFDIFERHAPQSKLPSAPKPPVEGPVVFIGHGRSAAWRDLKDHLHDKHGVKIEAYETGARAGHTIRDILEEMVERSSFAILVMSAEDEQADGQMRTRQNVIHEAGLFQGALGFPRAILLLEEDVEEFSNVQGVQYIRFSKGNIKETFGEILATLRREFSS